jgi:hypothetical protein
VAERGRAWGQPLGSIRTTLPILGEAGRFLTLTDPQAREGRTRTHAHTKR